MGNVIRTVHYIGAFLLFASAILLLIPSISAPVVSRIGILNVDVNGFSLRYGAWGWCDQVADFLGSNKCSATHLGYAPKELITNVNPDGWENSFLEDDFVMHGVEPLTRALILHPIACGVAFIAFVFALLPGVMGALLPTLAGTVACVLALAALIVDAIVFGQVKSYINLDNVEPASFGSAFITTAVAFALLFIASVICLVTCCGNRRERRTRTPYVKG